MTTTSQSTSPLTAGAGVGAVLGVGFGAGAAAAAGCVAWLASSTRIGEPCDTLSPTLILTSFTTPAPGDGISIVALSDSSVTSDCSFVTASPGLTRISMTSTFLKSPMSGTFTSVLGIRGSACGCPTRPRPGNW